VTEQNWAMVLIFAFSTMLSGLICFLGFAALSIASWRRGRRALARAQMLDALKCGAVGVAGVCLCLLVYLGVFT
jgi:hypothetical protein